jgi:hypothetical protein
MSIVDVHAAFILAGLYGDTLPNFLCSKLQLPNATSASISCDSSEPGFRPLPKCVFKPI